MVLSRSKQFPSDYLVLLTVACWLRSSSPQLTVQVKEAGGVVLNTYTFPQGFSNPLDWLVTSYANLPSGAITAILYEPLSAGSCSALQPVQFCDENPPQVNQSKFANLTRWALVSGYETCTEENIESIRTAGYDGIVTFSRNDSIFDFKENILDQYRGLYFDAETIMGFPVVVVSTLFASVMQEIAISADTNTTECFSVFVSIESDQVRQSWIKFAVAFSMVLVIVGLPIFVCLSLCCCFCDLCVNKCPKFKCKTPCTSCCRCCANRGVYEVNQVHIRALGDDIVLRRPGIEEDETAFMTSGNNSRAERFQRVFENNVEPTARKYYAAQERNMSCMICLECFKEEETVHALSCDDHHVFHPYCIERWLETCNACPVCRAYVIQPSF